MRTMDHEMNRGMGRGNYREIDPGMEYEQGPGSPPHPEEKRDLTLGLTALMGIFLAVVLVCAVFFGFGYSTGRTLHGAKSAQQTPPTAASLRANAAENTTSADDPGTAATQTPPLAAAQPAAKPSAGAPLTDASPSSDDNAAPPSYDAAELQARTQHPVNPAATRTAYAAPAATSPESANAGPAVTGGVMVQIAAVARQADAEMLAQALRTNGYAAVVRTEPQDKFLHVQIGPFATRDQAKAMRVRLQAAGYNAFLKP